VRLHAFPYFCGEQRSELLRHLAVVEDVAVHVDVIAGPRHRLEHRPVRPRPVDQQARVVARHERVRRRRGRGRRPGAAADERRKDA
jgi:hypothetical protein